MNKTAIIVGSTGVTGSILLKKLCEDSRYSCIKTFSRSPNSLKNPKIQPFIVDLFDPDSFSKDFSGDELYCCIGTTKAKTPNEDQYYKVDFGIPVALAKLCKQKNINTYVVVSALGADAKSSIFYNRTKGKMEEAVLSEEILHTFILQPSLIVSKRKESRWGETFFIYLMKFINPVLMGKFKKYRSVPASYIADAMIYLSNEGYHKNKIPSDEIQKLAKF